MNELQSLLQGQWSGHYTYEGRNSSSRTDTSFTVSSASIQSPDTITISGKGSDSFGSFSFEDGTVTKQNGQDTLEYVKKYGGGWWWHAATIDAKSKKMAGKWGPYNNKEKTDGSLYFDRVVTREEEGPDEERPKEMGAATNKQGEGSTKQSEAESERSDHNTTPKKRKPPKLRTPRKGATGEAHKRHDEHEPLHGSSAAQEAAPNQDEAPKGATAGEQKQEQAAEGNTVEHHSASTDTAEDAQDETQRPTSEETSTEPSQQGNSASPNRSQAQDSSTEKRELLFTMDVPKLDPSSQPQISKDDAENVGGKIKIHVKLDLDVDIRLLGTLKGDIVIGIA